jgi:hypothetical protein
MPEGPAAVAFLRALAAGTRVVVRRREDDGFHDALGDLIALDDTTCTVETRKGPVLVPLAKVTRAKTVPPPPPRLPRPAPPRS